MKGWKRTLMWWILAFPLGLSAGITKVSLTRAAGRRPPNAAFRRHVVRRVHLVAVDAVIRRRGIGDDPVLRAAIEAASQVISGKPVFEPLLDPGAPGRERNGVAVVADERIDVCLRRCNAALFGNKH
jgi:hypothetical protein